MMKNKIKVKHIIWWSIGLLFFIFIIIPFANIQIATNLKDSKPEISEKLYEINTRYSSSFMKDESLYKLSEGIMDGFTRTSIFMHAWVGSKPLDYDTVISAIKNYEKILNDYPKSEYFTAAYKGILDSYVYLGLGENLEKWIDWGRGSNNDEINQISIYYDGYNHFVNREYDRAEEILDSAISVGDRELDYIYYFLKGDIEFMKENFDKSLEYYGKTGDIGWRYNTSLFGNRIPSGRKHWLEKLKYNEGNNKIRGRVMVEGKGIPFVPVYLQYPNDGYSTGGGNFIAVTDKDGYFESIGIKDGEYDIGVGIGSHIPHDKVYLEGAEYTLNLSSDIEFDFKFTSPMKVIKPSPGHIVKEDRFTVEWEEIEGADYYTIGTRAASIGFTIEPEEDGIQIKDNKVTLDLETLNNQSGGLSWSGDDSPVNPEPILGYFHIGAERPIIVSAYDKDGNMLSSSIPSIAPYEDLPSVKIEKGELSEGEKIILSQDYERAIKYYEDRLNKSEEDEEALKYLSKIHMVDWKKDKSDFNKAISYGERYYEVTGDRTLLDRVLEYKGEF